jgi:hypothetical protein
MLPNRFRYLRKQHAAVLIKKSKTSSDPVAPWQPEQLFGRSQKS